MSHPKSRAGATLIPVSASEAAVLASHSPGGPCPFLGPTSQPGALSPPPPRLPSRTLQMEVEPPFFCSSLAHAPTHAAPAATQPYPEVPGSVPPLARALPGWAAPGRGGPGAGQPGGASPRCRRDRVRKTRPRPDFRPGPPSLAAGLGARGCPSLRRGWREKGSPRRRAGQEMAVPAVDVPTLRLGAREGRELPGRGVLPGVPGPGARAQTPGQGRGRVPGCARRSPAGGASPPWVPTLTPSRSGAGERPESRPARPSPPSAPSR